MNHYLTGHLLYLLVMISFAFAVPTILWNPDTKQFILVIGFLATWRYGWAITNWVRYLIFTHFRFPKWAKARDELGKEGLPSHNYFLVTSFRIGSETTRRVYDSIIEEAIHCGIPTTIVVSLVERADQTLVKKLFQNKTPPPHVKLVFVRIAGTGKRDALAVGFRAISRRYPPEDAVVSVIDGDSMLPLGITQKCAPFFKLMPKLGALTTEEMCEVDGAPIFREWYSMRFAQRNIFMGSHSLSKRVLTLTGRMSMFRASIITDPEFIRRVEVDFIDHWRLGRFKFLTGDDKSSWFHILSQGYEMIYVQDAVVTTIETPPSDSFIDSSITLMRRWFGNMLRTNGRAIKLGPRVTNFFPWLAILDQRISMWTSLVGPIVAILASIIYDPFAIIYYFLWIMITRYVMVLMLAVSRPNISPYWPFLLYYNQIIGSFVKTIVLFRLDKQRWTRQNTTLSQSHSSVMERLLGMSSAYMQMLAFGLFVTALATLSGIIDIPNFTFWADVFMEY
jgi:glycosyltransferase Alg8